MDIEFTACDMRVGLCSGNESCFRNLIQHFADFKSKYVQSRNVHVWLPEGYSEKEQYAVLPSSLTHKIYFDYGDQTLDALYEPFQK